MLSRGQQLFLSTPQGSAPSKHERLTADMAQRLLAENAFHTNDDAMQSLRAGGFRLFDIMVLIDDARQAAFQQVVDIVAKEMSQSC